MVYQSASEAVVVVLVAVGFAVVGVCGLSLSFFPLANFPMLPPRRSHSTYLDSVEADSLAGSVQCSPDEDMTRQEFAQEADINFLLRKYGAVPQRPVTYGEVDFDLDFQQARLAMRDVAEGYARLPESVRQRFPTLDSLLAALASGEVVDLSSAVDPPAGGSAGESSAAASEAR